MDFDGGEDYVSHLRQRFFGKYRGEVKDNADDANCGRLKVVVPSVLGTEEVWAMPCVPYAGKNVGFYCLPEAGTGVWVEFEAGDVSFPIWTGFFWRPNELPDTGGASIKILKTEKVTLRIDDDADEVTLTTTAEAKLTVNDGLELKAGKATLTVASDGVTSKLSPNSVAVTSSSVSVNDGALEVA